MAFVTFFFCAFFDLFFDDLPFPLDELTPQDEAQVLSNPPIDPDQFEDALDQSFPLDELTPQDEAQVLSNPPIDPQLEESLELVQQSAETFRWALRYKGRWDPPLTSTPKVRKVGRSSVDVKPKVEIPDRPELPLEAYLRTCDLKIPTTSNTVKRMGLRV